MCAMEKAPGPDGFPMIFFQTFWEVLKGDIINTMSQFHSNQSFEKSFNATFIALIPKKIGASELKDYRPISLIGGVYKIIAKILAETEEGDEQVSQQKSNGFHKGETDHGCCINIQRMYRLEDERWRCRCSMQVGHPKSL